MAAWGIALHTGASRPLFGFRFVNPVDSPGDLSAGLTYSFDFDNDGVFETIGSNSSATRTFAAAGTFTIRGSVTDISGASTMYTLTVSVSPF